MTTIGALLLLAGIMVALPFILVGAGDEMWACVEREAAEDVIAWVEGRAERP